MSEQSLDQARPSADTKEPGRRDFLIVASAAFATLGTAAAIWPFIDSFNPSADVLAKASTEIDLTAVAEGQSVTVLWQGKPVFVRRRTQAEIARARADDSAPLPDPQTDAERAQKPEWLIMVGICTHLGCIPLGQRPADPRGEWGGWFCPCHGSHYDTSGRIRKGPAPRNLEIPPHHYLSDTRVLIG
jgi:ubiquinol-cytochrome c reductase iron-sulfur subunit